MIETIKKSTEPVLLLDCGGVFGHSLRDGEKIAGAALEHLQHLVPGQRAAVLGLDLAARKVQVMATMMDSEARLGAGVVAPLEALDVDALRRGCPQIAADMTDGLL